MAARKRIRRKIRRKAPTMRGMQTQGPAPAARGSTAGDLIVGGVMDPAEKAADQMAERALSGRAPSISRPASTATAAVHRQCAECSKQDKDTKPLKRAVAPAPIVAAGAAPAPAPMTAANAVGAMGSGRRMSPGERSYFEPRFGHDFGQVRIHEGPAATKATRALGAKAFARGTDIAFAPGERSSRNLAHELAHVVQDDGATSRTRLLRRACETCPSPVNPDVEATIQPIVSWGTPKGSKWGSTNWRSSSKTVGVSVWHSEKDTCTTKNIAGKDKKIFEVCPKKIKLRASVGMVLDKNEILKRSGGKQWFMECAAPAGKMVFDTAAVAATTQTTPKPITIAGVLHHENYHVGVSKRAVETAVKARADLTRQIAPYDANKIAKWKAGLEKTLGADMETQLKANPSEANEELNASVAECTKY